MYETSNRPRQHISFSLLGRHVLRCRNGRIHTHPVDEYDIYDWYNVWNNFSKYKNVLWPTPMTVIRDWSHFKWTRTINGNNRGLASVWRVSPRRLLCLPRCTKRYDKGIRFFVLERSDNTSLFFIFGSIFGDEQAIFKKRFWYISVYQLSKRKKQIY